MMRTAGLLLLAAAALAAAQQEKPRVSRAAIVVLEQAFDTKILKASAADPLEIMSSTQGVYLDGFGLVMTAQVDLIMTPGVSAFRQKMSKTDVERVRARKAEHLPLLRHIMQQMLVEAAAAMGALPPNEQVVLAVSLLRMGWEDTTGLPAQILMQAPRQKLLDRATAQNAIQVQEF